MFGNINNNGASNERRKIMKEIRKSIVSMLVVIILLMNSIPVCAQELGEAKTAENQYIAMMLERLKSDGEIAVEDIISLNVIDINISEKNSLASIENGIAANSLEAVQICTKSSDGMVDMYAIPFEDNNGSLKNITRSSVYNKPFEDSQFVYVLVTVTYYYYSGAETNWAGPYFRPTLVKAKWSDSTGNKAVKKIYANFNNANHVVNLSNNSVGSIVNKSSVVSQNNPENGITYVGNVINMSSNTAYSMYFNGIDTYSYVYGYVTDSTSMKYEFSFQIFDGSGLVSGI